MVRLNVLFFRCDTVKVKERSRSNWRIILLYGRCVVQPRAADSSRGDGSISAGRPGVWSAVMDPFDLLSIRKIVILSVPSEKFIPRTHQQQREKEIVKVLRQDCSGIFFFSTPDPSASRAALIRLFFVFLPSVSYTVSKQNILLYNLRPLHGFTSYSSLKVTYSTHFFIHIFTFHLGLQWRSLTGLIIL